jgi:hypothetical protein
MNLVAGVYLIGGITLISEIALPELPRIQQENPILHPVRVRMGALPNRLSGGVELDPDCFATRQQYLLNIQGVARYLVSDGREIVIDADDAAHALDVRGYLLGSIFVVLCQQRGLLPLHASAIAGKSGVVAFLANSGQGKSTLAAHLARRGFRVLADDVCLIDTTQPGSAMVIPTAPWLKLWRSSLENLGRKAEGLDRVFTDDDKYRLPLSSVFTREPILRLIFLEDVEIGSTRIGMEEIPRVQAVPSLMKLTHHSYVLEATGQLEENFLRCGRVLSQARAYRLVRPWGLMHLEATVDLLENLLLEE